MIEKVSRKVMLTLVKPMNPESKKHFSVNSRNKVYPFTFNCIGTRLMPYEVCKTKKQFFDWLFSEVGHNKVIVFSWKKGYYRKPNRLRPYKIAIVVFKEAEGSSYHIEESKFYHIIKGGNWWIGNRRKNY